MEMNDCGNLPGFELMGENVKEKLKKCGKDVRIHPLSKICKPEVVELGDFSRIGDFVFIWGGTGTYIGKYSDLQVRSLIWGGGETIVGDYVSVGVGSILLSAAYSHREGLRMVDHVPEGHNKVIIGRLIIENDVYIGANCTIMPNITIGEGAIIGACSLVNKDIEPWSINVGIPCKKISMRPKVIL